MLQVKAELNENFRDRLTPKRGDDLTIPLGGTGTVAPRPVATPAPASGKTVQPPFILSEAVEINEVQTRIPAIIGEAIYRGTVAVDGVINGQPGVNMGSLSVRQRGKTFFGSEPELIGELHFRDMLRVNGHIAGSVCSRKGTLIVDAAATVDAQVDVAIAVIAGTIKGDIIGHQRVEVASTAKIYGNIWTRSLAIQGGAIFEGVCQMLEEEVVAH